jgi:nucleotide-binding universal stress UspA family protein
MFIINLFICFSHTKDGYKYLKTKNEKEIMMYKHILVGFDDSEDTMKGLERATQLYSLNQDCKLTVVYVEHSDETFFEHYKYPVVPSIDGGIYPAKMLLPEDKLIQHRGTFHDQSSKVMDHAKLFLNQRGVQAEYELLDGRPSSDLCDFALDNNVDLIIVGNSGKGAFKKLLVGSVSESIMKKSEMDVLVVK